MVEHVRALISFLDTVFDAKLSRCIERSDGSIAHAEIEIDGSMLMLSEATSEYPAAPIWLHLYVPDVDEVYARALKAGGASIEAPKRDEEASGRRGAILDPSGNTWFIATHQARTSSGSAVR